MSRQVKLVGWLSGESDLAAQVKAHNPCKYHAVWQNGLGWARLWRVPVAFTVLAECLWAVCGAGAGSSPPPSPLFIIRRRSWSMGISHWCRLRELKWIRQQRQLGRGRDRDREGRREGGVFVAMAKGSSSSCWFACAVAHPFPFFSFASLSLSPLCNRQPFRREICALRGRLWTFLLQSFYAVRHTQGWETLSSKHREKILAGKEGYPCFSSHTGYSCCSVCGLFFFCFFFLTQPSSEAVALHHYRWTEAFGADDWI